MCVCERERERERLGGGGGEKKGRGKLRDVINDRLLYLCRETLYNICVLLPPPSLPVSLFKGARSFEGRAPEN